MIKTLHPKRHTLNAGLTHLSFSLKKSGGFTLVETLVSILIFGVTLTAIFYLLTNNLKDASLIKDNFIASGLVQEGVEVVRNIRDSDWYTGNPFGTAIPDGSYRVQWDSRALLPFARFIFEKRQWQRVCEL